MHEIGIPEEIQLFCSIPPRDADPLMIYGSINTPFC